MALFAGKLYDEIAELDEELAAEQEAHEALMMFHAESIADLQNVHQQELAALRDAGALEQANLEEISRSYEAQLVEQRHGTAIAIAALQGQIEALKEKGQRYDALILPWQWHIDGRVEIEGRIYQRFAARKDNRLADFALAVPEGMSL